MIRLHKTTLSHHRSSPKGCSFIVHKILLVAGIHIKDALIDCLICKPVNFLNEVVATFVKLCHQELNRCAGLQKRWNHPVFEQSTGLLIPNGDMCVPKKTGSQGYARKKGFDYHKCELRRSSTSSGDDYIIIKVLVVFSEFAELYKVQGPNLWPYGYSFMRMSR